MTSILIAGALLHLVLTASLVFGVLHYVQAKVKPMAILDELKTLLADLESLDFVGFVNQLKADATAAETSIETELHTLYQRLESIVSQVKAALPAGAGVAPVAEPEAPPA